MLDPTPRLPRVLLAALTIVSVTLFLSYTRISSTTYSLLWPEAEQQPVAGEEEDYSKIFNDVAPMAYGTSARPPMKGMPEQVIADLPDRYVPSLEGETRRLVIVGDVHGQKTALDDLLKEIRFDRAADHLILAGDVTNKGPDSAGVVALAMELGAHAVRGNHDDRVLLTRAALHMDEDRDAAEAQAKAAASAGGVVDLETKVYEKGQEEKQAEGGKGDKDQDPKAAKEEYLAHEAAIDRGDKPVVKTARSLSPEQAEWLAQLPVILNVGRVPRASSPAAAAAAAAATDSPADDSNAPAALFENMVVVHAGLVPGVALADQDPTAVMSMRTLEYPIDEERRSAVKKYLQNESGHGGDLAKFKFIDDDEVDELLAKAIKQQGLNDRWGEVALPTSKRDGSPWWEEWNHFQERLVKEVEEEEEREKKAAENDSGGERKRKENGSGGVGDVARALKGMTVVYGHDAKSGLKVPDTYGNGKGYTYGLDSGCVYGGKLSALIIEARPEGLVHGITQVDCKKAVDPDDK